MPTFPGPYVTWIKVKPFGSLCFYSCFMDSSLTNFIAYRSEPCRNAFFKDACLLVCTRIMGLLFLFHCFLFFFSSGSSRFWE